MYSILLFVIFHYIVGILLTEQYDLVLIGKDFRVKIEILNTHEKVIDSFRCTVCD